MHPEVVKKSPDRCPVCAMTFQKVGTSLSHIEDRGLGTLSWKSYVPLVVIFSILILSTFVLAITHYARDMFSWEQTIGNFMAGFFLVFSGFKLMDLKGFAEGYGTYDLLAQRWLGWGYLYPFVELGFGLIMLVGIHDAWLLWLEIIVMSFSGIGVMMKLRKNEVIQCACLGTFLKVPLTNITLIEDFGMAALALILFLL